VFDVADPDLRDKVKALGGADVGYDVVGGDAFNAMLRCMKFEGRLLTVGFASGEIPQVPANLLLVKNISVVGVYWGSYARNNSSVLMKSLVQLTQWLKEGQLRPHVSAVYSLDEATQGLEALANRQSVGKVVIKP
ncbi:MAG: zinc-binding dehydrogenase, partial [Pseudomonadota bacterium]|nr:zinc-binding dehydrogenase [Pseudomonadota bacterium]